MKHNCIIRAASGTAGGWIEFSKVIYKGKPYIITKDFRAILKVEATPSDEPLFLRVTPDKSFSLNYDDDPNFRDNKNDDRRKVCELIPYHHQMNNVEGMTYHDGSQTMKSNPNAGTGMIFEFEDMAADHVKNVKNIKLMGAAYNKVNNMSYKDKLAVMYYYGENPTVMEDGQTQNMRHSEAFVRLVEPGFGIVYRRTQFGNSGKTFLDHFVNDYNAEDASYALKTTILKAQYVRLDDGKMLIGKAGAAWMFGNDVIGSGVEEAIVWFNNHEQLKEHLFMMVAKADSMNDDDLDEVLTKFDKPSDVAIRLAHKSNYEDLKAYCKSTLRLSWKGVPTLDSLNKLKDEAEPVWAEVKELGLTDEIDSQPEMKFEDVKKRVTERKKELLKKEKELV